MKGTKINKPKKSEGRPPHNANQGSCLLIQKAIDIYGELNHKIVAIDWTGGGTDAGFASLSGNPVIDGLGIPGQGYHSD